MHRNSWQKPAGLKLWDMQLLALIFHKPRRAEGLSDFVLHTFGRRWQCHLCLCASCAPRELLPFVGLVNVIVVIHGLACSSPAY